jgi:hypothetical protein
VVAVSTGVNTVDGSRSKIGEIGVNLSVREKGEEPPNEFERGAIRGVSGEWSRTKGTSSPGGPPLPHDM